ncbi:MotA/TolQ/ExbB proton channel family protein [Bdellovibrio sp. SKB1291214]|uniref:motility protein A n=1 Tax=Bdellovibrio sp. SKB1291214 TaxID=1732569 RepID=UPI000B516426|nr:MotA/TolQ/ExbB proton channel family protein [Bdellovibrio sp. SKB1291214]UYL07584.1 MotA/TolQ/ExbB proton channel family protein [Bdellovibrio sp. SKB1291214]
MNLSALLGLLMAFSVMIGAMVTSTDKAKIFLDTHAFVIVIGGTIAASLLSFSAKKLLSLMKVFFKRTLGKNDDINVAIVEMVDLAKGYRENENYLRDKHAGIKTPFLKEAIGMLNEGAIDSDQMDKILNKRAHNMAHRHEEDAEIFKALAKFPPAFGLLGAVIGIISLMANMGGADAAQKMGPSFAIALVATMYGIAVANFIFLPLGENLAKANRMDQIIRQMVIDGFKLIRDKKHPIVVEESIKSYLLPSERGESANKKAA